MPDQRLLGIDIGTTGIKSALYDLDGHELIAEYGEHPLICDKPGWAEQDPQDWWKGVRFSVRRLIAQSEVNPETIAAIGVTGQQPSPVFLDGDGEVVGRSLIWMDRRTIDECAQVVDRIGSQELYKSTGLRADAMYGMYKIMWLKAHAPELYRRVRYVLQPKDFVNFRLTGIMASDHASSAAMQGLSLAAKEWDQTIFQSAGVPISFMPPLLQCTQILGPLQEHVAQELGLSASTKVVVSAGDTTMSALGCGVCRPGDSAVVIGTSSDVVCCVGEPVFDAGQRIGCYPYVIPELYMTIAGGNSSGIALRWLRDQFFATEPQMNYDRMTEEASGIKPGCDGLIFLPYLSGERSPVYDPNARGIFAGISLLHTRAHFVRAVLEGVAFSILDRLTVTRALGVDPPRVFISGGGAKSQLWRQIVTDMIGIPTERTDVSDSALLGAVMTAAVGCGIYPSLATACERMVRLESTLLPDSSARAVYEKLFPAYRELYRANAGIFRALNS